MEVTEHTYFKEFRMIAQIQRLDETKRNRLLRQVAHILDHKYWWLGETCTNELEVAMQKVMTSDGFQSCDYPTTYLDKSLKRAGEKYFQKLLKQVERYDLGHDLINLENERGVFRNGRNRIKHFECEILRIDVRAYLVTLNEKDRLVCEAVMEGYSFLSISRFLDVTPQAISDRWKRIIRNAQCQFRSYEHECN